MLISWPWVRAPD
jgi:hypothetical protein